MDKFLGWKVELNQGFTIPGRRRSYGEQTQYVVEPKTEYFATRDEAMQYYKHLIKLGAKMKSWIYHVKQIPNPEGKRGKKAAKKIDCGTEHGCSVINLPDILRCTNGKAA